MTDGSAALGQCFGFHIGVRGVLLLYVVEVLLADCLQIPLPDGDDISGQQFKVLVRLPYIVHVHQKTLMTAQKTRIVQLLFNGIQAFINVISGSALTVEDTLGVGTLHILNIMIGDQYKPCLLYTSPSPRDS